MKKIRQSRVLTQEEEKKLLLVLGNIKRIRQSKGLTQDDVADKLKIATLNYGKIENKHTALTFVLLLKIADILGVNVLELIGEGEELAIENSNLKKEIDALKEELSFVKAISESGKNKVEMANETWEELKMLRMLLNKIEYLDFIDIDSFKTENSHYFRESIKGPYIQIKEFINFVMRLGQFEADRRLLLHIDLEKYKESDKIIEESKSSGQPVEKRIQYIKNLQKGKGKETNKIE